MASPLSFQGLGKGVSGSQTRKKPRLASHAGNEIRSNAPGRMFRSNSGVSSVFKAPIKLKKVLDLAHHGDLDYCRNLTDLQKSAVCADSRPLMIIACAGSGKTRTLTTRICHFLQRGAPSHNILAITFTRKAAEELRSRIEQIMGWELSAGILVLNFHQFALRLLRQHYRVLGFTQQFIVLGARDQKEVVKECIKMCEKSTGTQGISASMTQAKREASLEDEDQVIDMMLGKDGATGGGYGGGRAFNSRGGGVRGTYHKDKGKVDMRYINYFTSFIRKAKQEKRPISDCPDEVHKRIYQYYINELRNRQAIDFNDMIPLALHLFEKREDIMRQSQQTFKYVFVDEFQDLTIEQINLIRKITGSKGHITVCGDDDQSIYGWRGAAVQGFDVFAEIFNNHQSVVLNETFRNTGRIVRAVSCLIKKNTHRRDKVLWTKNTQGELLDFSLSRDDKNEAAMVLKEIKRRMQNFGLEFRDFAVLGRTRRALQAISDCFKQFKVPYSSSAKKGRAFRNTKEVLDLLAYLRLIAGDDDKAFERVVNIPKRGLGSGIVAIIRDIARSSGKGLFKAAKRAVKAQLRGITIKHRKALLEFLELILSMRRDFVRWPVKKVLGEVISRVGYLRMMRKDGAKKSSIPGEEAISKLLQMAAAFDHKTHQPIALDAKLHEFYQNVRKKESDKDEKRNHVTLSTIHQAKGLEWPVVFVIHFNDGILPLMPRTDDHDQALREMEEERRLAYVAMSRAKSKLYLSCVQKDMVGTPLLPSRFLDDIPQALLGTTPSRTSTQVSPSSSEFVAINNTCDLSALNLRRRPPKRIKRTSEDLTVQSPVDASSYRYRPSIELPGFADTSKLPQTSTLTEHGDVEDLDDFEDQAQGSTSSRLPHTKLAITRDSRVTKKLYRHQKPRFDMKTSAGNRLKIPIESKPGASSKPASKVIKPQSFARKKFASSNQLPGFTTASNSLRSKPPPEDSKSQRFTGCKLKENLPSNHQLQGFTAASKLSRTSFAPISSAIQPGKKSREKNIEQRLKKRKNHQVYQDFVFD